MAEPDTVPIDAASVLEMLRPITTFAEAILTEAEGISASPARHTAHGLLHRAWCWLRTLQDLGSPYHYQANLTAARAMIEITVDLAYLTADSNNNEKLEAWEQSARLRSAEALCRHVEGGGAIRLDLKPQRKFIEANAAHVAELRQKHWPPKKPNAKARHPDRWTGRSLIDDVKAMDAAFANLRLGRTYAEIYSTSCWFVHGSGLLGMRGKTPVDGAIAGIGLALLVCGELAFACVEFSARILGMLSQARMTKLHSLRTAWYRADGYPEHLLAASSHAATGQKS